MNEFKRVYIVGIEGAGTSALAGILRVQGKEVVGSDEGDHFYYDVLRRQGIKVFHRFDKDNPRRAFAGQKIDLVIYSTVFSQKDNVELREIKKKKLAKVVWEYPRALAEVFNRAGFGIAVCGTHGKTTTTAMLGTVLQKLGLAPTVLVGAKVLEWGSNCLVGNRKDSILLGSQKMDSCTDCFVIEADEYQNKLRYYQPRAVILTSVDYDHPDFFKSEEEYKQVFKDFVAKIPADGFLVAYAGDKNVVEVSRSASCEVVFYDKLAAKDILLGDDFCSLSECRGRTFGCCPAGKESQDKIRLFGEHNLLNAMAVFRLAQKLNLDLDKVKKILREFRGTARRFEIKGEFQGALIVDDYAHHPAEIRATLKMVKERYPNKVLKVIFHPHTFSRTEALLSEFVDSFKLADEIYFLDIFGSAREREGKVDSDDLVASARKKYPEKRVENLQTIEKAVEYFRKNLGRDDILLTMGAGDVYLVAEKLLKF